MLPRLLDTARFPAIRTAAFRNVDPDTMALALRSLREKSRVDDLTFVAQGKGRYLEELKRILHAGGWRFALTVAYVCVCVCVHALRGSQPSAWPSSAAWISTPWPWRSLREKSRVDDLTIVVRGKGRYLEVLGRILHAGVWQFSLSLLPACVCVSP